MRFDQLNPYLSPPERFPADPPEFWTEEIRRVTDTDGDLLVVYRDQDGETFVMNAYDYDNPWDR